MLFLAVEIAGKGYLLDIQDLDSIHAIPESIASLSEGSRLPDELVIGKGVKKLIVTGLKSRSKIEFKVGSRIILAKSYPEHAVLIEFVRGVQEIDSIKSTNIVMDNIIYKFTSLTDLLELELI